MIGILGAGGHAKVVISTLRSLGFTQLECFEADESRVGQTILGIPIRGTIESCPHTRAVIAIGSNAVRKRLADELQHEWITVIHPSAIVDPSSEVAAGSVVFAGGIIQPDVHIGEHCIINTGAQIDHDGRIEAFVHLGPGSILAGNVSVGEGSFLGARTTVIPGIKIGAGVIVGAGSTVIHDLVDPGTYVGTPTRKVR